MAEPAETTHPLLVELRNLRILMNIQQEDLARRAGVDPASLSYWEMGRKVPSFGKLMQVIDELGFSVALVAKDDASEAQAVAEMRINTALEVRDRALAERNKLVEAISRLINLPPEAIARAYEVGYEPPKKQNSPTGDEDNAESVVCESCKKETKKEASAAANLDISPHAPGSRGVQNF